MICATTIDWKGFYNSDNDKYSGMFCEFALI